MDRETLQAQLRNATTLAVDGAKQYVLNKLPPTYRYRVLLNQSYDGNGEPDEILFPEEDNLTLEEKTDSEVIGILWRDHAVPEWININVNSVNAERTLLELTCCGRYSSDHDRLYYFEQGTYPFGIKSPLLPPQWDRKTKFSLPKE
ncbi:MAG: hypothetical protein AB8C95_01815 [Phycisphaeraceae bacterium]